LFHHEHAPETVSRVTRYHRPVKAGYDGLQFERIGRRRVYRRDRTQKDDDKRPCRQVSPHFNLILQTDFPTPQFIHFHTQASVEENQTSIMTHISDGGTRPAFFSTTEILPCWTSTAWKLIILSGRAKTLFSSAILEVIMKTGSKLAIIVFSLVAIAHLLRLVFAVDVTVGDWEIAQWISLAGFIVPAIIALLLWRESK
jgi:cyclophilin family peptidyl-prolyl cis-trans isomerase